MNVNNAGFKLFILPRERQGSQIQVHQSLNEGTSNKVQRSQGLSFEFQERSVYKEVEIHDFIVLSAISSKWEEKYFL